MPKVLPPSCKLQFTHLLRNRVLILLSEEFCHLNTKLLVTRDWAVLEKSECPWLCLECAHRSVLCGSS